MQAIRLRELLTTGQIEIDAARFGCENGIGVGYGSGERQTALRGNVLEALHYQMQRLLIDIAELLRTLT